MKLTRASIFRWSAAFGLAWVSLGARADENIEVAVNARVFNGYTRTKLADGTFKPEFYAFGEGGRWDVSMVDKSIDTLPFLKIVRTMADPLRAQGYLSATDPKHTDLLILVFWGMTMGAENGEFSHAIDALSRSDDLDAVIAFAQGENQLRDKNNAANARILGFSEDYRRALELQETGHVTAHDTVRELEANRYFVVLKAYDFRTAWKQKKMKLMWEARFSIYERGNQFDRQLLAMTLSAARYFGQDTKGLVLQELPEGKVKIGTPTVVEPEAKTTPDEKR